jgi:hypothetical protein
MVKFINLIGNIIEPLIMMIGVYRLMARCFFIFVRISRIYLLFKHVSYGLYILLLIYHDH